MTNKHPFLRFPEKEQKAKAAAKKKKANQSKSDFFIRFIASTCNITLKPEVKPFHDTKHRVDYAEPVLKIAVEQEGGIWMKGGGAHSRPQNIERDIYKYTRLATEGWIVIRRQPNQMNTSETVELIKQALKTIKSNRNE